MKTIQKLTAAILLTASCAGMSVSCVPRSETKNLKIICYNILYGMRRDTTQGKRLFAEWVRQQNPDILALQEVNDFTQFTLETLAAVTILRRELPELKIRVVNVVDLMKLQPHTEHPHGLTDAEYDTLFTKDKPIIFAYHGYPTLIHELTYRRHNRNLHVRGYKEEGTITTPFDMRVLNDIDRFDLVIDTVRRLPQLGNRGAYLVQKMNDKLVEHRQYIKDNGVDLPEVRAWKWNDGKGIES